MALESVSAAETQLAENLLFEESAASARLALEAVRYLLAFRARDASHGSARFAYTELISMEARLTGIVSAANTSRRRTFVRGRAKQW
jgi:hypothetical protein